MRVGGFGKLQAKSKAAANRDRLLHQLLHVLFLPRFTVNVAAEWVTLKDQAYEHFRREFRRQAHKLTAFGEQQNLEGATYAYLALVTTCVDCHTHCRDVLRIAAEPPNLKAVPIPTTEGRIPDEDRNSVRR